MDWEIIISLITLTFMEIVLGIDNIVFISIVSDRLPKAQQPKARTIGLSLALVMRIALLLTITWIVSASEPLFEILEHPVSIRDLILMAGGLFLLAKSTTEIHHKLEGQEEDASKPQKKVTLKNTILMIVLLDIVFSFDSILTAVGLANEVWVMVVAVIIAMGIMLAFSGWISRFINQHPTVKMLALSFLILIGFMLLLEGIHLQGVHVPKGYIYFAIFFSLFVEVLNMRLRKKSKPVQLHDSEMKGEE